MTVFNNGLKINKAFVQYFAFNNARTLSTDSDSQLEIITNNELSLFIDPTRRYDNQIVIHNPVSEAQIKDALSRYGDENRPEISVEPYAITQELSQVLVLNDYLPSYAHEFLMLPNIDVPSSHSQIKVERWSHDRADDFQGESLEWRCSRQRT